MALNLEVNILGDYKKLTAATNGATKKLTAFGKVGKAVNSKLGVAFTRVASAFAAAGIVRKMLAATKAAAEDMQAQKLLAMSLERSAKAKSKDVQATEDMIGRMELATGIADDELRPAMGKLAAATKSVSKAQTLLKVALGVSVKYGKPLDAVVSALSKAFNGNAKSLQKMFPQYSKTKDVIKALKADVKSFAKENSNPYERLQRGLDNLQETVGGPLAKRFGILMDKISTAGSPESGAVTALGKSIDDLGVSFETFFKAFDSASTSGFVGFVNVIKGFTTVVGALLEAPSAIGSLLTSKKMLDPAQFPNITSITQEDLRRSRISTPIADKRLQDIKRGFVSTTMGLGSTQNFYVTIKPTTSMTPDETVKMIRAWEKKHGIKWTGPVR